MWLHHKPTTSCTVDGFLWLYYLEHMFILTNLRCQALVSKAKLRWAWGTSQRSRQL
ncbi:hypothetical protein LINGRAHAP2_LOCUS4722 [Linum grandiflorum]